ncbi:CusA/CzcA family heavy metal efflux RND transporter [Rapidithrix thailandica]|uniref:CusA/CzcA family heavy metal efflux RND transporter n=1 Tax=Rapidithrix thailandica TaxID=413964 RepID=A0AAW9SHJ8_9BACT
MIDRIIHFSVNNKLLIGLFVIGLLGWGLYSLKQIPMDAVPDITNNQVQVVTVSPALSPQEVEKFITYPVEIAMANIPDVTEIRSISRYGLSVVTIVFEENVEVLKSRQLIGEQLQLVKGEIPETLGQPELMPITTGLGEIYQYTLDVQPGYVSQYSATDLRTLQDWIVKRQLSGTPGIVEVSSFGGFLKQYEVSVKPEKLRAFDITLDEVVGALARNNENTGGSYIQKGPYAFYLRTEGLLQSAKEIEKVVVKTAKNLPILIKDVAEVKIGASPRFGAMTKDGKGEAVGGITLMLKNANASEVTERVKTRISEIQKSLPEGIVINAYLDRADLIDRVIKTVRNNLVEGGLIVIFVLVILLGNLRAGLVVASVIPLSMLFALAMMNLFGISANLMSLGAIDFGLVVDGAVIIVESVIHVLYERHKNKTLSSREMNQTVIQSASQIMKSAVFGMVIILIVYIPIMTLVGVEGKMFKPMAYTVSFAILGALILSLTYVPMMSSLILSKKVETKVTIADRIIALVQKLYLPAIHFALKFRKLTVSVALVMLISSIWLFSNIGSVFIPTLEEGDLAMQMTLPPGSSLNESVKTASKAEKVLLEHFPEVKHVVSKIGTAEVPTDPMGIENGDIMITLKPKEQWESAESREELVSKMKKELEVITGAVFEFTQPIQLRFNELITGVKSDVAIKIYGDDLDVLAEKGSEAAAMIEGIQGAADTRVQQSDGLPQISIRYDRDKMAYYGLDVSNLNTVVNTAMSGQSAGNIYEGERKFDLVVRLEQQAREQHQVYQQLFVRTSFGTQVPVSEVANIDQTEGPLQISRDNTQRFISVGVNVRERDIQSLVNEIQQTLEAKLELPSGYYIVYGGAFENLQRATNRLKIAVPAALLLIFVLLYFAFSSIKEALMIFSAIPLSAIGGVWALWLRDMPFSISAGVGFIALFGVAVLNGIVLISYFNHLKKEGVTNLNERIISGTTTRLRPVLMTAMVASLGFLPMAISTSAGGEVQQPLATVVIGGLVTATVLTLVVLPVIYSFVESGIRVKISPKILWLPLLGVWFIPEVKAQSDEGRKLTLEEALEMAISNNPTVKNAQLQVDAAKVERQTSLDIGNTVVEYQRGQINSEISSDYNFTIAQEFGSPINYFAKKGYLRQQETLRKAEKNLTENAVRREVTSIYYKWNALEQKYALLNDYLQLYEDFVEVSKLRFETGESNLLSKVVAETKKQQLEVNLQELKVELNTMRKRLQSLLFAEEKVIPVSPGKAKYNPNDLAIEGIESSSLAQYYAAKSSLAAKQLNMEKAKWSPRFSVGYFNQKMNGVKGFTGWQAGIALPLWFLPQKARVQSGKLQREVAENESVYARFRLKKDWQIRQTQVQTLEEKLSYYTESALPQAALIIQKSKELYENGEIAYYEYVQNLSEAMQLQSSYWDTLNAYNQLMIEWAFMTE